MKNFIILSIMIILAQSSFAQIVTNSGLERLERKLFNDTYRNENIDTRLNRLEVKMFGAEQTGTLDERYMTLKNAAKNYKTYTVGSYYPYTNNMCTPTPYPAPLFTYGQGSNWRQTMWNNFRNYAGVNAGMPTGITPAMDPAYMDWFEADRASRDSFYSTNNRMYRNKRTTGTGSGVTIID